MQKLNKQRETDTFVVAEIIIDDQIVAWTVADKQMQRYTDKNFRTAAEAFEWGEVNFRSICDD